ncbi:MAG TPA: lipid-A-disaccharide synthase [Alphaproteobacteria bacterium]|nr:lipid-A-disaccharide synthase [Alphaproteobacteria bacterium]
MAPNHPKRPTRIAAKVLIVAGEASGDLLGAELMAAIKKRNRSVVFYGVGGPAMKKAGLKALGSIRLFPGMGLAFLPALPGIIALLKGLAAWADKNRPAVCITIDNQEFSARLAKRIAPLGIPCVQYVAPKVWAWRQGRVKGLRKVFSHMLCLFPFEASFFNEHNLPASYVGHPVVERMARVRAVKIDPKKPVLAIFPGSRKSELEHHWPLFLATFLALKQEFPNLTGKVVLVDKPALTFCRKHGWDDSLKPVWGEGRFAAMAGCSAALTKSGTNNLELALLGVPAVVAYRGPAFTLWLAQKLVKVKYASPPNLVINGEVYPEFIQNDATLANLYAAVGVILTSKKVRNATTKLLKGVALALKTDIPAASKAAQIILPYLLAKTPKRPTIS